MSIIFLCSTPRTNFLILFIIFSRPPSASWTRNLPSKISDFELWTLFFDFFWGSKKIRLSLFKSQNLEFWDCKSRGRLDFLNSKKNEKTNPCFRPPIEAGDKFLTTEDSARAKTSRFPELLLSHSLSAKSITLNIQADTSWGERCFRYVFGVQINTFLRGVWMLRVKKLRVKLVPEWNQRSWIHKTGIFTCSFLPCKSTKCWYLWLTYPLQRHFWRWFSFSPGGIC